MSAAGSTGRVPDDLPLLSCERPLIEHYAALLLDLDGVCYVGSRPVDGAAESLAAARHRGLPVRFITNNASRPPAAVVDRLVAVGIDATVEEVLTSATCAAVVLAGEIPPGSPVLVVGGRGVVEALDAAGLRPVASADDDPIAVVQGWDPDVGWRQLAEGCLALRSGARWIATNLDRTVPDARGILPGNGSLVAALAAATGLRPRSIGKPEPTMYTAAAAGLDRPLAVGDRLDTDIAGGNRAGHDTLLVLSGVSSAADLLRAGPEQRPRYVAADLRGLLTGHPAVVRREDGWTCGQASARVETGRLTVSGGGGSDGLDRLRAAAAAAWTAADLGQHMDDDKLHTLDLDQRVTR